MTGAVSWVAGNEHAGREHERSDASLGVERSASGHHCELLAMTSPGPGRCPRDSSGTSGSVGAAVGSPTDEAEWDEGEQCTDEGEATVQHDVGEEAELLLLRPEQRAVQLVAGNAQNGECRGRDDHEDDALAGPSPPVAAADDVRRDDACQDGDRRGGNRQRPIPHEVEERGELEVLVEALMGLLEDGDRHEGEPPTRGHESHGIDRGSGCRERSSEFRTHPRCGRPVGETVHVPPLPSQPVLFRPGSGDGRVLGRDDGCMVRNGQGPSVSGQPGVDQSAGPGRAVAGT